MPRRLFALLLATLATAPASGQSTATLAVTPAVLVNERPRPDLVALCPDGTLFTCAPVGGDVIRVADTRTGRTLYTLPDAGAVECEFTADGSRLVVLRSEGPTARVEVRDALTGRRTLSFALPPSEPVAVGGRYLFLGGDVLVAVHGRLSQPMVFEVEDRRYSSSSESFAGVYDVRTGRRLGNVRGSFDPKRLAVSADGRTLVACDDRRSVRLYDLATLKLVRNWEAQVDDVAALAVSRDGSLVAAGQRFDYFHVYDAKGGIVGKEQYARTRIDSLAFAGDGPAVFVGSAYPLSYIDDDVHQWRLLTCNWRYKDDIAHVVTGGDAATRKAYTALGPILPRLISRDGRTALAVSDHGVARVSLPAIEVAAKAGRATGITTP